LPIVSTPSRSQAAAGIRRRPHQDGPQQIDDGVEARVIGGVVATSRVENPFTRRAFLVAVHDQIAAVVEREKIGDRAQHDLHAARIHPRIIFGLRRLTE
jgi:hypothetical protein